MSNGDRLFAFQSLMVSPPWSTEPDGVRRYCEEVKSFGATDIIANRLADPYPLHVIEQPGNPYVWFTTWGPSLDQYVSSKLTYGLYPEVYLGRNRLILRRMIDIFKEYGLRPWLFCGEPRFLPERFYRVYPHLRGPRVDNPNCSVTPLYAPCTDYPEVHEHYREMMTKMMEEFPELAGIMIYSGDSGTGFCHSESLYPGRNGPRFCMSIHPGVKIRKFLTTLLDAGRKTNPEFMAFIGHYIWHDERVDSYENGPEGIGGWLNGYFCAGGLEDCYANMQYPGKTDEIGYDKAREERLQVMVEQLEEIKGYGRPYLVPTTAPMEGWLTPNQMVPNPYQALGMVSLLRRIGAEHLTLGGISDPGIVPFDVNRECLRSYMQNPKQEIDNIVSTVALNWVGEEHADALCKAWRLCDEACRKRPMFSYTFGHSKYVQGPMVPDETRLTEEEKDYFYPVPKFQDGRVLRAGPGWMTGLEFEESYRDWMIERFRTVALPPLAEAEVFLESEWWRAASEDAKACLDATRRHIGVFHWYLREQYNWLEVGRYTSPGKGKSRLERSLAEIIDDQIESTKHLIDLVRSRPEQFLVISEIPVSPQLGPDIISRMGKRIEVMELHRNDTLRAPERAANI
jgi:hypothetical protein